jgi:predicted TIM-barrel fold metal-dependent hydrolase
MYKIFSVDDHIIEPPDVWTSRLPSKYVELGPHVVEYGPRQFWAYEDRLSAHIGLNAVAGKPRSQWNKEPARFADMIPGCYDPKQRAQDIMSQGVLASLNFPTIPRFAGMLFNDFDDKVLADLCVKAWNDFVLEEWCPGGPEGLFVPGIICQVWDPAAAAAEITRCVEKGARSLFFPENPAWAGLPSIHNTVYWDPIWSVCTEADIPLSMHSGSGGSIPVADELAPFSAVIASGEVGSMLSVVNLLVSPVPEKYPTIKFVFSEGGIGWIPAMLQRADRQLDRHSGWAGKLHMKPSEIFARNMWCCMVEEPLGLSFYPHIGAEKILSETDYPHADSTFPRSQQSFTTVFKGIPDDVVELVSHGNAEKLYRWKMADESLLTSPSIAAWRKALDEDPLAATHLKHDVAKIKIENLTSGERCGHVSERMGIMTPCGQPVGPDGVCTAGHALETVG